MELYNELLVEADKVVVDEVLETPLVPPIQPAQQPVQQPVQPASTQPVPAPTPRKPRAKTKTKRLTTQQALDAVAGIEVPSVASRSAMPIKNRKIYCDLLTNIQEYIDPLYTGDTGGVITYPLATTCTLNGTLSNVNFHESDLIKKLELNDNIAMIECNFGEKVQPWYTPKPKPQKPPQQSVTVDGKPKPPRKIQGNGKCFASQITIITAHANKTRFFKVKVFRNGFVQIPGSRPDLVDESFEAIHIIIAELSRAFNKDVQLTSLYLVMKDYKLTIPLKYDQALDLYALKTIFSVIKLKQIPGITDKDILNNIESLVAKFPWVIPKTQEILNRADKLPPSGSLPPISDIKYNYYENKFSASFGTPTDDDPDSHIQLVIFHDGYFDRADRSKGYGCKVGILGAVDRLFTYQVYTSLMNILINFRDLLVVDVPSRRRVHMQSTITPRRTGRKKSTTSTSTQRVSDDAVLARFDRVIEFPPDEVYVKLYEALDAMLKDSY